jgi:acetyl-CoA carboxylase biotin carboxyl carrier protein
LLNDDRTFQFSIEPRNTGGAPVDLKDIKAIIDLMKKNSVSEFELEKEGFKIRLRRGGGPVMTVDEPVAVAPMTVLTNGIVAPAPAVAAPVPVPSTDLEIKSPMIGTFYRAPSPESGPYVEIGTEVNPDSVVCIIEAMKVMNEIKAEAAGVVTEVLVENSKPVEFGQPLFKIRPV